MINSDAILSAFQQCQCAADIISPFIISTVFTIVISMLVSMFMCNCALLYFVHVNVLSAPSRICDESIMSDCVLFPLLITQNQKVGLF